MEQQSNLQPLGALDDTMPDIDLALVLGFECSSTSDASRNLSSSFGRLLQNNPWLRGYVHVNIVSQHHRPGTKFLSFPADTSSHGGLSIQDLSQHDLFAGKTYETLVAEHVPSQFLNYELLVPGRDTGIDGVKWILRAQVTFIRGGALLCVCTSHAVMDATGLSMVLDTWARLSSGAVEVPSITHFPITAAELGLSRECDELRLYKELKQRKELWHMLGLDYRPKEMTAMMLAKKIPIRKTETRVFKITQEKQAALKQACSMSPAVGQTPGDVAPEEVQTPNSPTLRHQNSVTDTWISTNDAISALLWRCIMRARVRGSSEQWQDSSMQYAMNIRHLLPDVVPGLQSTGGPTTAANVVIYSINEAAMTHLIEPESLAHVAKGIRENVKKHQNPVHMREALILAATIPDVSALSFVYPTWLRKDLVISSLLGLDLYNTHWAGKSGGFSSQPDFVRFPAGLFDGITFVMPRQKNGDVEIVVTMIEQDMKALTEDNEWKRYVQELWV